jgi:hypothetical protein
VQYQRDDSHNQQQVDETARQVKCKPAGDPHRKQDEEQNQEDKISYHM